jgi:hypothetical protein
MKKGRIFPTGTIEDPERGNLDIFHFPTQIFYKSHFPTTFLTISQTHPSNWKKIPKQMVQQFNWL